MDTPRRLPIVEHDGHRWYFDERLRQIRTVENPHEYRDLDGLGMAHFRDLVRAQRNI